MMKETAWELTKKALRDERHQVFISDCLILAEGNENAVLMVLQEMANLGWRKEEKWFQSADNSAILIVQWWRPAGFTYRHSVIIGLEQFREKVPAEMAVTYEEFLIFFETRYEFMKKEGAFKKDETKAKRLA